MTRLLMKRLAKPIKGKDAIRGLERLRDGVVQPSGLPDRTFERSRGCWNCVNSSSREETTNRWFDKRDQLGQQAVSQALASRHGENDRKVVKLRVFITTIDQAVAAGNLTTCSKGRLPNGDPVGDFVATAYMCDQWTGKTGHSLAAHSDGKPEILPEELRDIVDGSEPMTTTKAANALGVEQ